MKPVPHVKPPFSLDIETRVIGTLLNIAQPFDIRVQEAMLLLDAACFHNIDTRELFLLIEQYYQKGEEFSFITLSAVIPQEQFNFFSGTLREGYYSANSLEHDVAVLNDYKTWRFQLKVLVDTINSSLGQDLAADGLSVIANSLSDLNKSSASVKKIDRTMEQIIHDILSEKRTTPATIKVDIPGLPPVPTQDMIVIAGRSGAGKTLFGLYLMESIGKAMPHKAMIYYNLEMNESTMVERYAMLLGHRGADEVATIKSASAELLTRNLHLVSEKNLTIEQIQTHARTLSLRNPISVIVVDYLALVSSKTKYERHDLLQNAIAKALASLAGELKCTVILLTQINRDIKNRKVGERCPVPTDSAESMGSVHSATWWLGIDRPEIDSDDPEFKELFQVVNRKNRIGELFFLQLNVKTGYFSPRRPSGSMSYASCKSGFIHEL